MREFPIRNKLYIAFILAISVALTTHAISDTSYAQNNSITSEGTTDSLNKSPIDQPTPAQNRYLSQYQKAT